MSDDKKWYPGKYLFGSSKSKDQTTSATSESIKEGFLEKKVSIDDIKL